MRIIIFCLLFGSLPQLDAQESASWRFHLQGYNLVFPGLEVAYEHPLYTHNLGQSGQKLQLILAPVADIYAYRGNHTGIGLNADLSLKYISANGFQLQAFGGYGLVGAVLAGEVYEPNASGGFESSSFQGNIYPQWKVGVGLGKKLADKPLSINFRIGVREAKLPAASLTPNLSIGINWYLNPSQK